MGLIKTAMYGGAGLFALNRVAKVVENGQDNHQQKTQQNRDNVQRQNQYSAQDGRAQQSGYVEGKSSGTSGEDRHYYGDNKNN